MKRAFWIHASPLCLAACLLSTPGVAQEQRDAADDGSSKDIVVTARKRQESDISVPVSITAISAQQIERSAILNMHDIAQRTPSLSIVDNTSGTGGNILLRGIGTLANISNTIEQSVSISVDGAPISRGNAVRIGQYDLGQIEILKGPQALFFGKNSAAGVISLRSKDPTQDFELMAKAGYEPYANTRLMEFAVSGPLTDWLRARLFGHIGATDGAKDNLSSRGLPANAIFPGAVYSNPKQHGWAYDEKFVRATVIIEPSDRFTARLIGSYNKLNGTGNGVSRELFYCPQGKPQTTTLATFMGAPPANVPALANALAVDDCKLNDTVTHGGINPAFLTAPNLFSRNPAGASVNEMSVNVADLNYRIADHINITSVSAYVWLRDRNIDHYTWGPGNIPFITYYNYVQQKQFTQELRVTSDFETPINFMIGGFYQDATLDTFTSLTGIPPYNVFNFRIPNKIYSGFAQLMWDITPQLELAGGARYTREKKSLLLTRDGVAQVTDRPRVTFNNTSPEATLTWRPSGDLTAYLAYKTGFKSGGYASTVTGNGPSLDPANPRDFSYEPEKAKGFEAGVKAALFDRALRIDTTVYAYDYSNLQVSFVDASGASVKFDVINAASVQQRGAEVEATFYPRQVPGLRINGTVNYNESTYKAYNSPCYIGQSITEGCSLSPVNGRFSEQSLAGRRLANAPLWVGALGFNYETPLSGGVKLEVGTDAVYRSPYNVAFDLAPGGFQKSYAELNAHFRLISEDRSWELGVFAKNLTNVRRALDSNNVPLTGNAAATGTAGAGPASRADLAGNTNPSRAIYFQLTLRPSIWMK
jgi:iron complex outermembrane receptor protein